MLALRSEDDIDITVYDSAGNVVNPSTAEQAVVVPGAASAGGGGGHPEVSAAAETHPVFILVGGTWIIRIERLRRAAAASTTFKVIIGLAAGGPVLKRALELSIGTEQEKEFDFDKSFDSEETLETTWTVTPTITTLFGTLKLVPVTGKRAVRVSHVPSEQCPTGTERSWTGEATLTASGTLSVPVIGDPALRPSVVIKKRMVSSH